MNNKYDKKCTKKIYSIVDVTIGSKIVTSWHAFDTHFLTLSWWRVRSLWLPWTYMLYVCHAFMQSKTTNHPSLKYLVDKWNWNYFNSAQIPHSCVLPSSCMHISQNLLLAVQDFWAFKVTFKHRSASTNSAFMDDLLFPWSQIVYSSSQENERVVWK